MNRLKNFIKVDLPEIWLEYRYLMIGLILFCFVCSLYFYNPLSLFHDRSAKISELHGETIGTLIRISPKRITVQGQEGSYTSTLGYDYEYVYVAYGTLYTSHKYLADNSFNKPVIDFVYSNINKTYININFSEIDNEISMINIKKDSIPKELINKFGQQIYGFKYSTKIK